MSSSVFSRPASQVPARFRFVAGLLLSASIASAQSIINWQGANGTWTTTTNWSGGALPTYLDTARFTNTGATTLSITGSQSVDTMNFVAGAPAYTFNITTSTSSHSLSLYGAGIVNNSSNAPTFNLGGPSGGNDRLDFRYSSSAGNAVINVNNGGYLEFMETSNAGTATVTSDFGGGAYFYNSGTASNATFNLTGSLDIGSTTTGTSIGALNTSGGVALGSRNLTVGSLNTNTTISGVIADNYWAGTAPGGSLTKVGTGTLTLSAANTYTGATVIGGGTLLLANSSALGTSTLNYNNQGGALSFGTLTAASLGGLSGAQDLALTNASNAAVTLTIGGNNANTTYSGNLSGGNGLTKTGTGALTLSGTNTYSGNTTISNGALVAGSAAAIPASSNIRLGGGVLGIGYGNGSTLNLDLGTGTGQVQWTGAGGLAAFGGNRTVQLSSNAALTWASTTGFVGNGNALVLGSSTSDGTLTLTNAINVNGATRTVQANDGPVAVDAELSGAITGTGGLTKSGAGTLLLSGANTYSGATTINGGALRFGNASALPSTSNITLAGGVIEVIAGGGPTTFTTGTGAGQVQWSNGGGGFSVAGGDASISLNAGAALTWNSGNFGTGTSSALILSATSSDSKTTLANNISLAAASRTVQVNNGSAAIDAALTGVISGATGSSLVKTGAGTLALSGVNTWTGTTVVNGGLINFSALNNFGSGTITLNGGGLQWAAGNTLDISLSSKLAALGSNGATFDTNGNSVTLSAVLSGSNGALIKSGAGTLTLSGNNTYTGTTTIANGTVNAAKIAVSSSNSSIGNSSSSVILGSATTSGTLAYTANANTNFSRGFTVNAGGGGFNVNTASRTATITGDIATSGAFTLGGAGNFTVQGTISGTGSLIKSGTGTLIFDNSFLHTYTGGTTISAGTLQIGTGAYTGLYNGNIVNNGAVVFNHLDDVVYDGAISGTGTFTQNGFNKVTLTGNNTYAGATTINSGGTLQIGNGGTTGSISGSVTNNGTLAFNRSDSLTYSGVISGAGGLSQLGSGTLTLSGANTFTGDTTISAGTLALGNSNALQNSTLNLGAGGTFSSGALTSVTLGGLAGSGSLVNNFTGANGLTIGANGVGTTFSGAITGTGNLTKTGTGILTLSGANSYGGATTIANGTLQFAKSTALPANPTTTSFVVNSGATAAFNVGGSGEFTAANLDSIKGLGSATGGFASGSSLGIDTTNASGGSFTYGSAIANPNGGSNVLGLTKLGGGTLVLTGANTYTGTTTVASGTLRAATGALAGSGVTLSGGNLELAYATSATLQPLTVTTQNGVTTTITADRATTGAGVTYTFGNATLGSGSLTTPQFINIAKGGNVTSGTAGVVLGNVTSSSDLNLNADAGTSLSLSNLTASDAFVSFGAAGGGGDYAVSGVINLATGALFKTGAGTLTLSGNNVFSGASNSGVSTTVSGGTLRATTSANALGSGTLSLNGGALQLANNTGLNFGRATTIAANTTITSDVLTNGAAGVTHTLGTLSIGAQTLTVAAGSNVGSGTAGLTFSGTTTLSASGATFAPGAGTLLTLNAVGVSGNRSFAVTGDGNTVILGNLTVGTGTLTKSGNGTLTLSGSAAMTGATSINGGTLIVGVANALGTTTTGATTVANGATLGFQGGIGYTTAEPVTLNGAGFTGRNGALDNIAGTNSFAGPITLASNAQIGATNGTQLTLSGVIGESGGARALTLNPATGSSGSLVLNGVNTYTGGTIVNGGTVNVGSSGRLSATTGSLTVNGGTLIFNNPTAASFAGLNGTGGTINLSSGGLVTTTTGTDSFAGLLAGTGGLTKSGSGSLAPTGANTYTGVTLVNGGTLAASGLKNGGVASSIGQSGSAASNLVLDGGTLSYTGGAQSSDRLFTVGTGGATLNASGSGALQLTNTGSVVASGSGNRALTLGGTNTDVNVLAGSLANPSSGSLAVNKTGAGTWVVSGTNTYSGATTISGGTLQFATVAALPANPTTTSFVVNSGASAVFNVGGTGEFTASNIDAVIQLGSASGGFKSGSFIGFDTTNAGASGFTYGSNIGDPNGNALGLLKLGSGTLTLTGANLYSGDTYVNSGTLTIGAGGALSPNTHLHVATGASFNPYVPAGPSTTTVSDLTGGGNVNLGGSGSTLEVQTGNNVTNTFQGALTGDGGLTLNGSSTGTLVLAPTGGASNSYTGPTTITSGTVQLGANGALPSTTEVQLGSSGTLDVHGTTTTIGQLAGSGTVNLGTGSSNAGALTIDQGSTSTFSGNVTGTGNLNLTGSGSVTLSGTNNFTGDLNLSGGGTVVLTNANTYTGNTVVTSGTLVVNNGTNGSATGSGTLTVGVGGTIAGSGTIAGDAVIGGVLAPGNSPGLQIYGGNLTLLHTTIVQIQLGGYTGNTTDRGTLFDAINVGQTLTFGNATLTVVLINGFSPSTGQSYNIFDFGAASGTFGTVNLPSLTAGLSWDISSLYVDGSLSVTGTASAIPEPSTYAALAGLGALLIAWQRRRRAA